MNSSLDDIGHAADTTLAEATISFALSVDTGPTGVRIRSQGVCDIAARRASVLTTVDTSPRDPAAPEPTGVFQIVDGSVVYTQVEKGESPEWGAIDMKYWEAAAAPLPLLGWVYGAESPATEDRPVRFGARRALERCPESFRAGLQHSLAETGQLEAEATGSVRLDGAGRVVAVVLDIAPGGIGQDGIVHDGAHLELELADFGVPVSITLPDSGLPTDFGEFVDRIRRHL